MNLYQVCSKYIPRAKNGLPGKGGGGKEGHMFYIDLHVYRERSGSVVDFCLFCCFTSQVNSYGHCETVSSPNHNFPGQA